MSEEIRQRNTALVWSLQVYFDFEIAARKDQIVELMAPRKWQKILMREEEVLEKLKQEKVKFKQKLAFEYWKTLSQSKGM